MIRDHIFVLYTYTNHRHRALSNLELSSFSMTPPLAHALPTIESGVELDAPAFIAIDASAAWAAEAPFKLRGKVILRLAETTSFKHVAIELRGVLTRARYASSDIPYPNV